MKLWIYYDYGQIVKVGQQTYVGSEAQQSRQFCNLKDEKGGYRSLVLVLIHNVTLVCLGMVLMV